MTHNQYLEHIGLYRYSEAKLCQGVLDVHGVGVFVFSCAGPLPRHSMDPLDRFGPSAQRCRRHQNSPTNLTPTHFTYQPYWGQVRLTVDCNILCQTVARGPNLPRSVIIVGPRSWPTGVRVRIHTPHQLVAEMHHFFASQPPIKTHKAEEDFLSININVGLQLCPSFEFQPSGYLSLTPLLQDEKQQMNN